MRKKALIAQNLSLFEQIEHLRAEVASKDEKIKALQDKISQLGGEEEKPLLQTTPLAKLEKKVISNSRLSADIEYASSAIGDLVLDSATKSNTLTSDGNVKHRELVNLLLGKTEVAKAEILSIVSEEVEFETKKEKIDAVKSEALDYFASVLAQVN